MTKLSLDSLSTAESKSNGLDVTINMSPMARKDNSRPPTHLVFKDISVTINNGEKTTLQNVSGEVEPGEVLAIMGPSGSGKTTLLNILAGRQKRTGGELKSGVVAINGKKMSKSVRRNLGYVLQDDVFFSNLTMRQTLNFAAELRLPDTMSHKQKMTTVDEVIETLDIAKCEETLIGGGLFSLGGLSGGERKRTSIGVELITNPSLLMMDEPTSGLDSSTAYSLVRLLKYIAVRDKKAIVLTIHQPSSQIFYYFDKLLLLCNGRVSYFGKSSGAIDFFDRIGLPCYPNWNPADYIMEMLKSGRDKEEKIVTEFAKVYPPVSDPFVTKLFDWNTKSIKDGSSLELSAIENSAADNKPIDATSVVICNGKDDLKDGQDDALDHEKEVKKWASSFKTQVTVLSRRTFLQTKADIWDKLGFFQNIILALVCGLLWFQSPYTEENLRDRTGVMFFVVTYFGFSPLFQALISFPNERPVINKERAAGMYRLSAYYIAKSVSEVPLVILHPSIFWIITYWLSGLNRSAWFLVSWMLLLLNATISQSIGFLIGASVKEFKRSLVVATVIMLSFMLLGGFYTKSTPSWLSWVRYVSFITYSFGGMVTIEFSTSKTFSCDLKNTVYNSCKLNNGTIPITGAQVLEQMNVGFEIWECFLAMFVYLLILRFITYFALKYLNKPK